MKFYSFLLLFTLIVNSLVAQNAKYSHTLDSIITTNNDTSSYIKILGLYTKQEFSYDSVQNSITELLYERDTLLKKWYLVYKTHLFYDVKNQSLTK